MVACTAVATAGIIAVVLPRPKVGLSAVATSIAGLFIALGLAGVSVVRRRERRLVRAHDDALHKQIIRTAQLLSSARELTSESSEAAIYCGLPIHADRLLPFDDFQLALFEEKVFLGRYSEHGLIDAKNAAPTELELHVARVESYGERSIRESRSMTKYELALPIVAGGELIAVFSVRRASGSFTIQELEDAATLCAHAGIALEKARALAQVVSIKREWEALFHSTTDGLALVAADGTVRRANDALVALAGTPTPSRDHHSGWFTALSTARCPICETIRSGVRAHRIVTDEAGRTLEVSTTPASAGGAVLVVRDVTTARAADESLRQARQRVFESEKLAAVGRLAAGVSHEVNNPLMGIGGIAAVLLEEDQLDGDTREALELIQREARRAAKITRDLLHFVRIGETKPERIDTNELVREVAGLRTLAQQAAGISLTLQLAEPPVLALASAAPLIQVLVNLVTNAEDAVAGSERRAIRVVTQRAGERVRIVVDDSGPGVPAEIRDRLFEPFFTTKAPGKGTGLGLSLCYSIVEQLGGTIRLESREEPGARFVVELPGFVGAAEPASARVA
jgi:two-component system NtrC family sensor kinase